MAVVEMARIAVERHRVVRGLMVGNTRLEALVATFRIIVTMLAMGRLVVAAGLGLESQLPLTSRKIVSILRSFHWHSNQE